MAFALAIARNANQATANLPLLKATNQLSSLLPVIEPPSTAEGNQPVIEPPSTAEGNQPVIELSPPIGDFTQVEWMSYEFCEGYPPRLRSNQTRVAAGEPELSMMCSTFRDATYSRYKITWFQIYLHEFLTDTQLIALQSERYNSFYL